MVCNHGWKSASETNTEVVIDVGYYYVSLGNLADSVAPGKKLINIVAELAIYIMSVENQDPNKHIMPLRVAVSHELSFRTFFHILYNIPFSHISTTMLFLSSY
jgi:hypothetical protein